MRGFNYSTMSNMLEVDDQQRRANGLAICAIPAMEQLACNGFGEYGVRDTENRVQMAEGLLVWVTL